ncbi:MAG: DUF4249 domain-containing protein [Bacteroidota bacterium]|nr:DUF4249 domain-containing protein [Bacteroidota bacterium]
MKQKILQRMSVLEFSIPKFLIYFSGIILLLISTQSCIEPYRFETPEGGNRLVVDGFITTEYKSHEVLLSLSTGYYDDKKFTPVLGASVRILSDQGEVFNLNESSDGLYATEPLTAVVGRSYKITIEMHDGKMYESGFELVIAVTPFDTIHYEYRVDEFSGSGITVFAINSEPSGVPTYLKWEYTGHQEVFFVYEDINDYDAGEIIYSCISTETCTNCLNISSDKFQSGSSYRQYISRIPYNATAKYIIKIDKFTLSPTVFEYFSQINRIINNSGTVFDSPPTLIRGNIVNIHDEDEIVHGYFYASDVYSKIFTVRRDNIPYPALINRLNPRPCSKDPMICSLFPLNYPDPLPCKNEPPPYWN